MIRSSPHPEASNHLIRQNTALKIQATFVFWVLMTWLSCVDASDSHQNNSWWSQLYEDIEGKKHLHSSPSTKAIVWIFIMEDCPISNAYTPEINRLVDAYHSRDVSFVLIHSDPKLELDDARNHRRAYKLKPAVVVDRDHVWVKYAGAKVTPEAFVFDPCGKRLYHGRIDDRFPRLGKRRIQPTKTELRNALDSLLNQKPILTPKTKAVGCYITELPPAHRD